MDISEYKNRLKEIRKKILSEIDKSLEHHDANQTVEWLIALSKIEEFIVN